MRREVPRRRVWRYSRAVGRKDVEMTNGMARVCVAIMSLLFLLACCAWAQDAEKPAADPQQGPLEAAPGKYVLGPGDEIVVKALDVEEIKETPTRIDMQGEIKLPLID